MEPGAPTRQSDHSPTHEQANHDQNYKAVVQGYTRHPDEKSRQASLAGALAQRGERPGQVPHRVERAINASELGREIGRYVSLRRKRSESSTCISLDGRQQ